MSNTDIISKLKKTFKDTDFLDKETTDELNLDFTTKKSRDYDFYIWIESPWTTLNIGARLRSNPDYYFWFESAEKLNVDDKEWKNWVDDYIFETVNKLVNHDTRIIQKDGILFSSFKCEYFDNGWKGLGKNKALRGTINVPKISGLKRIYE